MIKPIVRYMQKRIDAEQSKFSGRRNRYEVYKNAGYWK